jgi:hypothetical protein
VHTRRNPSKKQNQSVQQANQSQNPQSKKLELLIIINRFSKMSQGRSSEGMQWGQNPAKSWPGSRIIAT